MKSESRNVSDPAGREAPCALSPKLRVVVLLAAFAGQTFDGMEIGLMPVASLSVSASLLGSAYTPTLGGDWFARFTAALMLGATIGGIVFGSLGDRIGRTRTMGLSILFYSVFAGLGAFAQTQEQMLALRFLVGLGIGGMWPTGVALVAECWPNKSRPVVAGIMGAGTNAGVLLLSQLARTWPLTPDSWRWLFKLAGFPAVLGLFVLFFLPESPKWLATRKSAPVRKQQPLRDLFKPDLIRLTIVGILLGSIPLVGAWAGSKWMIPWADKLTSASHPGYKAIAQGWWALGATLGSFLGAQIAPIFGRRLTYFIISLATTLITVAMFQLTAPLKPSFLPIVFAQGFVATLFFGWLALYLPELFPTRVRASGSGLAMNIGRFATAAGIFLAGALFTALHGSYSKTGAICALVYALGLIVIWWAPDTSKNDLSE